MKDGLKDFYLYLLLTEPCTVPSTAKMRTFLAESRGLMFWFLLAIKRSMSTLIIPARCLLIQNASVNVPVGQRKYSRRPFEALFPMLRAHTHHPHPVPHLLTPFLFPLLCPRFSRALLASVPRGGPEAAAEPPALIGHAMLAAHHPVLAGVREDTRAVWLEVRRKLWDVATPLAGGVICEGGCWVLVSLGVGGRWHGAWKRLCVGMGEQGGEGWGSSKKMLVKILFLVGIPTRNRILNPLHTQLTT